MSDEFDFYSWFESVLLSDDGAGSPPNLLAKNTLRKKLDEILDTLDIRQRAILLMGYGLVGPKRSGKELAYIFNVSEARITQIKRRALDKIRREAIRRGLRVFLEE